MGREVKAVQTLRKEDLKSGLWLMGIAQKKRTKAQGHWSFF
jgi:hypothetical protein